MTRRTAAPMGLMAAALVLASVGAEPRPAPDVDRLFPSPPKPRTPHVRHQGARECAKRLLRLQKGAGR